MRFAIAVLVLLVALESAYADKLVLVAGGGTETEKVPATKAKLIEPFGVDIDPKGNLYVVELKGERTLKVDPAGILTIFAGTGMKGNSGDDGPARQATFDGMHSLAVHPD